MGIGFLYNFGFESKCHHPISNVDYKINNKGKAVTYIPFLGQVVAGAFLHLSKNNKHSDRFPLNSPQRRGFIARSFIVILFPIVGQYIILPFLDFIAAMIIICLNKKRNTQNNLLTLNMGKSRPVNLYSSYNKR